jgi:hypothetical protein
MNRTKLYILYKGNNVLFTGDSVKFTDFSSLELKFGSFYKSQIAPFIISNVTNLWQIGIPSLKHENFTFFQFAGGMPYYVDDYPEFDNSQVRIFLKYNNDNNPFYVATITPNSLLDGLTKIGGYITIFGLLNVLLVLYNQHSFETKLLNRYRN